MKKSNRFFALLMAVVMCLSLSVTAFAAQVPSEASNSTSQEDSGIMPLSSINGYATATLSPGVNYVPVYCDASGIGGMGITIKTSCSKTYDGIYFAGAVNSSLLGGDDIEGTMSSNSEVQFHNLYNGEVSMYVVAFNVPEGQPNCTVQIWIYG